MFVNLKSVLLMGAVISVSACAQMEEYPTGYDEHTGVYKTQQVVPGYEGRIEQPSVDNTYDVDAEVMNNSDLDKDFQAYQRKGKC